MKRTCGFTIIELLIVITIMSFLISMGIVNFFSLNSQAKDCKAKSDLRILKYAIENYATSHVRYPSALYEVEGGPTLTKLPKDPFTENNDFQYFVSRDVYAIWSVGFNGTSGIVSIGYGGVVSDTDDDDIGFTNGACPNKFWQ